MNLTRPTTLVLHALANGVRHGFDILDATGLPSGTVYPILRRMEREALVSAHWEDAAIAHAEQRLFEEGDALWRRIDARRRKDLKRRHVVAAEARIDALDHPEAARAGSAAPELFVPDSQSGFYALTLVVRTSPGSPATLAVIGIVIGIAVALAFTRLLGTLLFGVTATDPVTFLSVSVSLLLVSLAACSLPAWRALEVDPVVALRVE